MAKEDISALITKNKRKPFHKKDLQYDSGRAAGIYSRGNILLGNERFITSLKVNKLRKSLMNLFF